MCVKVVRAGKMSKHVEPPCQDQFWLEWFQATPFTHVSERLDIPSGDRSAKRDKPDCKLSYVYLLDTPRPRRRMTPSEERPCRIAWSTKAHVFKEIACLKHSNFLKVNGHLP